MHFQPMKYFLFTLVFFTTFFSSYAYAVEEIDSIAVIVNDDIITNREINDRLHEFKLQIQSQGKKLPPEELLRKKIIERMITDNIQLQLARAQGINIDDLRLNKALESIARSNQTTLDEMRRVLQSRGVSYDTFREQTRRDMIMRELQRRVIFGRVKVSDQEIENFLEQQKQFGDTANEKYHLAHILIATPEAASPEDVEKAENRAQSVISELQQGKSFNDVALNFSDGRHALKGGDLGWRGAADLPPLFLNTARKLKKGEVSPPLRSASGFHILKLLDKKTRQYIVKQTHARHILIKTDELTTDDEARKKLQQIKQRIDQGEDFAKLAAEYSQDPGSKTEGGDLGWATEGTFVPRFTEVMNSLDENQISEPFKSQFGWHILQVLGRRQQDETQKVIRRNAARAIQNRKADEELQIWLRRIRSEAYVEYRIDVDSQDAR